MINKEFINKFMNELQQLLKKEPAAPKEGKVDSINMKEVPPMIYLPIAARHGRLAAQIEMK